MGTIFFKETINIHLNKKEAVERNKIVVGLVFKPITVKKGIDYICIIVDTETIAFYSVIVFGKDIFRIA